MNGRERRPRTDAQPVAQPEKDVVERGEHLRQPTHPGRREPYVAGPTGPAPLASELRGDPGDEGDRSAEGGTAAGVVAGAAAAGPVGGVVGGVVGAVIGSAADEDADVDDPGRTAESSGPAVDSDAGST
jgi:hypothetical protein